MSDGKTGSLRQLLSRLYGQVGEYRPVGAAQKTYQNDSTHVPKLRNQEEDNPGRHCGLLYHNVACGKQGTHLGVLTEEHQDDIPDKRDQQRNHRKGGRDADAFQSALGCCKTEVRVDDHGVHGPFLLDAVQQRLYRVFQRAGAQLQNHVAYHRADKAGGDIIPFPFQKRVADDYNETDKDSRLRKNVVEQHIPDTGYYTHIFPHFLVFPLTARRRTEAGGPAFLLRISRSVPRCGVCYIFYHTCYLYHRG